MNDKKPKPRKCRCGCGQTFTPRTSLQVAATPECALILARKKREACERQAAKAARKANREAKEKLKTRSDWMREAQVVVNAYVRQRDADLPCVSCGRPASWNGQWHASHLRSVGAASAVRFNLWNIHKACSICNHHKSGNLSEYEPRLRVKIGNAKVDWLYTQNHQAHYTPEYLARMKSIFMRKTKLKKVS